MAKTITITDQLHKEVKTFAVRTGQCMNHVTSQALLTHIAKPAAKKGKK